MTERTDDIVKPHSSHRFGIQHATESICKSDIRAAG